MAERALISSRTLPLLPERARLRPDQRLVQRFVLRQRLRSIAALGSLVAVIPVVILVAIAMVSVLIPTSVASPSPPIVTSSILVPRRLLLSRWLSPSAGLLAMLALRRDLLQHHQLLVRRVIRIEV